MPVLDPHAAAAHRTRLSRLAFALCGSAQLADDLTQETYVRVFARSRRLRGGGDFPYLARTLRNVFHDHWRAQGRRPALVSDEKLADQPQTRSDGDPHTAARVAEVYAAVAALPQPLRDIVTAIDLAGLTYAEAAAELRIPVGTVMSRLYRARARIAGALEDPERTLPT